MTTPGVDGVYIGPSDLALALGLPAIGDNNHPKHVAAVERIRVACASAGIAIGIHTSSVEYTQRYLVAAVSSSSTLGSDGGFMSRAASEDLRAVRDTAKRDVEKTGY